MATVGVKGLKLGCWQSTSNIQQIRDNVLYALSNSRLPYILPNKAVSSVQVHFCTKQSRNRSQEILKRRFV